MGDLLNNGRLPTARATLAALRDEMLETSPKTPVIAAFGNHDFDAAIFTDVMGPLPSTHHVGGYRLVALADRYAPGDVGVRTDEGRSLLRRLGTESGGPLVVLQHNPMWPPIIADYPYMLTNDEAVRREYAEAGVLLSLSGHYHAGQPLSELDGVQYLTAPALSEAPFPYLLVTLKGQRVSVETRRLRLPDRPALVDSHVHTEFGYCAQGMVTSEVLARAQMIGLAGLCLTEHAPQLYSLKDDFWVGRHIDHPDLWRKAVRQRMDDYCRTLKPLSNGYVRVGLEVEADAEGHLTLHDEDRQWPDLLIGAVHFLGEDAGSLTDAQFTARFMRTAETLVTRGVQVLGHPWRVFQWAKRPVPTEMFVRLAEMLAATGTAAEINFHGNQPQAGFMEACLARGVKVALGSDSHRLHEVGSLGPHLDLLQRLAGRDDISDLLLFP